MKNTTTDTNTPKRCFCCGQEKAYTSIPLKWEHRMRAKYIGRVGFDQFEPYETSTMVETCIPCAHLIQGMHSHGWDFYDAFDHSDSYVYVKNSFDVNDWNMFHESIQKPDSKQKICHERGVRNLVNFFQD